MPRTRSSGGQRLDLAQRLVQVGQPGRLVGVQRHGGQHRRVLRRRRRRPSGTRRRPRRPAPAGPRRPSAATAIAAATGSSAGAAAGHAGLADGDVEVGVAVQHRPGQRLGGGRELPGPAGGALACGIRSARSSRPASHTGPSSRPPPGVHPDAARLDCSPADATSCGRLASRGTVSVTPQASGTAGERTGLRVTFGGGVYPAEEIARGAAYELFSADEVPGFEWAPRPGGALPWRRFVHVTEVTAVHGAAEPADEPETPLLMPLHRERGWAHVHQLSQQPAAAGDPTLAAVRASAVVRRGTRMVKVLSARQLAGYVRGLAAARLLLPRVRRGAPAHAGGDWRCCAPTATRPGRPGRRVRAALAGGRPGRLRRAGRRGAPGPDRRCRRTTGSAPPVLGTGFAPEQRPADPGVRHPRTSPTCRCRRTPPLSPTRPTGAEVVLYTLPGRAARLAADGRPAVAAPAGRGAGLSPGPGVRADRRRAAARPSWSAGTAAASTRRWPTRPAGSGCWR